MLCLSSTLDTLGFRDWSLDPRTRSIIEYLEAVPPGTNGGMSPTGTLAAITGSLIIAVVTVLMIPYSHDGFSSHSRPCLWMLSRGKSFVLIALVG